MTLPVELSEMPGLGGWQPSATPPLGIDLDDRQKLAVAFRALAAEGCSEHMAGHVTVALPGNLLQVNPWGLWWDEVSASDICVVDSDGVVVEGRWDVTPAIHIHTELHRRRADARVVVHNHPYHVTVLAALGMVPEVLHQTGCLFDGEMRFVDEYTGEIDSASLGSDLADRVGDSTITVLANHGVIVTAPTVEEAVYKTAAFERQCRLAYDVLLGTAAGRTRTVIPAATRPAMKAALLDRVSEVYFAGWVRKFLRTEPDTFD